MIRPGSSYIDAATTEAVRARSFAYMATDLQPGVTLQQHRLNRRAASSARGRGARAMQALGGRYADDPVGNYETTDGGW